MKTKKRNRSDITQEDVEEWCAANGAQLCFTWSECKCMCIAPDMLKDDCDGERHLACAACAPRCTVCGSAYLALSLNAPQDVCGDCVK